MVSCGWWDILGLFGGHSLTPAIVGRFSHDNRRLVQSQSLHLSSLITSKDYYWLQDYSHWKGRGNFYSLMYLGMWVWVPESMEEGGGGGVPQGH